MAVSQRRSRSPRFYGWYIVATVFFASAIAVGTRQAFGLFVNPWADDFGVSVFAISAVASAGWVANGLAQPIVGKLTDRYGGRLVMGVSMLALGMATLVLAFATNIWMLAFVHAFVISSVISGVMFTPTTVLVARWFRRRRGTAMGIVTAGGSVGGMVLVPFMAYVLLLGGWRVAMGVVAGVMLLLALPALVFVVRGDPRDLGLSPDGMEPDAGSDAAEAGGQRRGPLTVDRWPQCFRSAPLWLLGGSYVVCGVTTAMVGVHFIPYASSEGIEVGTAALAFGVLSFLNLLGVLGAGWLSDRMPRKNILALIYWVRAIAFLLLALLPGAYGIWAFALVAGVSWLATVPLTSALASEIYGVKHLGVVVGLLTMVHQFGGAAAVLLAGASFTFLDTYSPAFLGGAVLLVAAGASSFAVRERAVSARYAAAPVGAGAG